MALLTSWVYPLSGLLYLVTTPELLQVVLHFLGIVTAASCGCTLACFVLLWRPHVVLLGRLLGVHAFTKLLAALLILAESGLPIVLIFKHRMDRLGERLFDTTLQLKLGAAAAPAGPAGARADRCGSSLAPLPAADQAALAAALTKRRQAAAAAGSVSAKRSLVGSLLAGAFSLGVRLLLRPRPNEGVLMHKGRDFATLGMAALVPGAALLLPLAVYRDSGAEVASLLSRYLHRKGIADADAQEIVVERRMSDLRGFGLVATALQYVPVLNWALGLSNHVGAALYAAHLEAKGAPLMRRGWL